MTATQLNSNQFTEERYSAYPSLLDMAVSATPRLDEIMDAPEAIRNFSPINIKAIKRGCPRCGSMNHSTSIEYVVTRSN